MMRKKLRMPLDRDTELELPSYTRRGVQVRRSQLWSYGQRIVLLHMDSDAMRGMFQGSTGGFWDLVFGNPSDYHGPEYILRDPTCPWSTNGQEPTFSFNCHAYSLGEKVGLNPHDWVEGECTDASMNTNPTDILLRDYFRPVKQLAATLQAAETLADDPELCEDDVVSFTRMTKFWGIAHDHSGRIRMVNRQNWLASKFREGRLLMTPIATAFNAQTNVNEQIRVYRFRKYR